MVELAVKVVDLKIQNLENLGLLDDNLRSKIMEFNNGDISVYELNKWLKDNKGV